MESKHGFLDIFKLRSHDAITVLLRHRVHKSETFFIFDKDFSLFRYPILDSIWDDWFNNNKINRYYYFNGSQIRILKKRGIEFYK
jgi:hypothetical protein